VFVSHFSFICKKTSAIYRWRERERDSKKEKTYKHKREEHITQGSKRLSTKRKENIQYRAKGK
jgi:hypothetical protein